jgi:tetratricopeptide (TPR) repeat protein
VLVALSAGALEPARAPRTRAGRTPRRPVTGKWTPPTVGRGSSVIYFTASSAVAEDDSSRQAQSAPESTGAHRCSTLPQRKPVSPEFLSHFNRGLAFERHGQHGAAAAAYRDAARIDPLDIDTQIHLGLSLRELGQDEEANRAFLTALDLRHQALAPPKRRRGTLPLDFSS